MRVETSMRARAVPRCGCSSTGPRGPGCVGARGGVLRRRVGSQDNLVIPVFFSSTILADTRRMSRETDSRRRPRFHRACKSFGNFFETFSPSLVARFEKFRREIEVWKFLSN